MGVEIKTPLHRGRLAAALLIFICFHFSCAATGRPPPQRKYPTEVGIGSKSAPENWNKTIVRAPWETWSEDFEPEAFSYATQSFLSGKSDKAMQILRGVEEENAVLREQAFERRLSLLLKLGRGKDVLQALSDYAGETKRGLDQLGPRLSLIAAFAYQNAGDPDQTLAWLGLTYRTSSDRITGRLMPEGERANDELTRLVQRIRPETFEGYSVRWGQDPYLNKVFSTERLRRSRGGQVITGESPQWFRPATYLGGRENDLLRSEIREDISTEIPPAVASKRVIGALLPLTSTYATHAAQVKRGLELALEQSGSAENFQLLVENAPGDDAGDEQAFQKLVTQNKAELLFGPLLVKSAQLVSNLSKQTQTPFVTFTKKKGITSGSPFSVRLGTTIENQVREASDFLLKFAGKRSLVIVSSENAEAEFQEEFPEIFRRAGGTVLTELRFHAQKPDSVAAVISRIEQLAPEALFFSGGLEESVPLLEALQKSPFANVAKIASATWDDPVQLRSYASVLEGACYVTPFFQESDRPVVRSFLKSFREKFGLDADLLAAQAYDAFSFVLKAYGNAPLSPQNFRKKVAAAGLHDGVTGVLSVQENGEFYRRMSVIQIRSGIGLEVISAGRPTGRYRAEGQP